MNPRLATDAYEQRPPLQRSELDRIAAGRRVMQWEQFPPFTKVRYGDIARLFPGQRVFACGSRVTGHYLDVTDGPEVRRARRMAGKLKSESDFDFWVDPLAVPIGELPPWADRSRMPPHPNEMVEIPH